MSPRPPPPMTASIGFVIPAFNAADTVLDTIASLLRQTRRDWRAVIVDDGSTDATADRVAAVRDPRMRLVRQRNRGLAGARNTGWRTLIESGAPEFVCFLDSDDTVTELFCELTLGAIGDADAVAGGYRMVGDRLDDLAWPVRIAARDLSAERLLEFNPLAIGAVLFRTSSLARFSLGGKDAGPFDEQLRVHEDWSLFLRMARAGGGGSGGGRWAPPIDDDLMLYRQREASLTGAIERMWSVGLDVIETSGVEPAAARARAARRWTLRHAARAAAAGDIELVARLLAQARPIQPPDADAFIDAAGWAILKHQRIGPIAAAARARDLAVRFASTLPCVDAIPNAEPRVRRALQSLDSAIIARAAADRVPAGHTLVLYGLGRQGLALLASLQSLPSHPLLAIIDDDPRAAAHAPDIVRLRTSDLTPRHIVLVTPGEPGAILARLAGAPAGAVLTLADLLEPSRVARAG